LKIKNVKNLKNIRPDISGGRGRWKRENLQVDKTGK
jgi:hypothetical protein